MLKRVRATSTLIIFKLSAVAASAMKLSNEMTCTNFYPLRKAYIVTSEIHTRAKIDICVNIGIPNTIIISCAYGK